MRAAARMFTNRKAGASYAAIGRAAGGMAACSRPHAGGPPEDALARPRDPREAAGARHQSEPPFLSAAVTLGGPGKGATATVPAAPEARL
jgi:hypothetical protein